MKKILLSAALTLCALCNIQAQAENYQLLEWDLFRFGYVLPSGDGVSGGLSVSTAGRAHVKDNIAVGLRYEIALFGSDSESSGVDIGASGSIAVMGDYYFSSESNRRAFAGMGIGMFNGGKVETEINGVTTEADGGSSIGILPRVGYDLGIVRATLEYNLAFKKEVPSYLGLNLALNLFGKYKG